MESPPLLYKIGSVEKMMLMSNLANYHTLLWNRSPYFHSTLKMTEEGYGYSRTETINLATDF
jgi:hypothetical protein